MAERCSLGKAQPFDTRIGDSSIGLPNRIDLGGGTGGTAA
jgi:hypothetical protein